MSASPPALLFSVPPAVFVAVGSARGGGGYVILAHLPPAFLSAEFLFGCVTYGFLLLRTCVAASSYVFGFFASVLRILTPPFLPSFFAVTSLARSAERRDRRKEELFVCRREKCRWKFLLSRLGICFFLFAVVDVAGIFFLVLVKERFCTSVRQRRRRPLLPLPLFL